MSILRTFTNKPGVEFDSDQTTILFAEDMNLLGGSIRGFGSSSGSSVNLVYVNAGNVGIGTTTPGSKLEVAGKLTVSTTLAGDTSVNLMNLSSTGYGLRSQGGGGSSGLYIASFNDYATNEKVRIDNNGNVGIGTMSPSAVLHLKAGSASANSAPLKFTAGILNTTPVAGCVEFDGDHLYFVDSGGTRRQLAVV